MKLRLDFVHPRPAPARLGWALLLLGCLALAWAGWRYQNVSAAHEAVSARLAALSPKPVAGSRRAVAPAETDAPATRRLLDADWGRLLDALEQSRPANVALLRVEAEAARGSLLVAATAKDAAAMLAYLERLEKLPVLTRVVLVSHQDEETEGLKTVRFDLRAQWGAP